MARKRGLWLQLGLRLVLLVAGLVFVINLPEPDESSILHFKNAIATFAFIILLGKYLFDTLFAAQR